MPDQFKPQRQATSRGREILPDFQLACPFLGFLGDSETRARQASSAHRCFCNHAHPKAISDAHQEAFCLSSNYDECPILAHSLAAAPRARDARAASRRATDSYPLPAVRSAAPPFTPRQPVGAFIVVMATVVLAFAIGLAGLVVVRAGWGSSDSADPTVVPTGADVAANGSAGSTGGVPAAVTATLPPSAVATTSASPTSLPSPTPSPTPAPTQSPAPTPAPTPVPTRPTTYVVLPGESYIGISKKLEIDVDDLLRANRRTVNTPLYPGDILQLP